MVIVTEINNVAYVKLNRPDVRNAFNLDMIAQLTAAFTDLNDHSHLRAVVLQGEGKVFCAGADLAWMREIVDYSYDQNLEESLRLFDMFEAIANCRFPVIAMVHGAAYGGAIGLMAACDEVIIEEGTQLCFSEVKLGIAPAVISAFVNKKTVPGKVRPLMLSGVVFNAHVAHQAGLATEVAPTGEGHVALQRVVAQYLQCGPQAVQETKHMLNELNSLSWKDQKTLTAKTIASLRISDEGQEGLAAFLAKRNPNWRA